MDLEPNPISKDKSSLYHSIENSISSEKEKELEENLLLNSGLELSKSFSSSSIKEDEKDLPFNLLDNEILEKNIESHDCDSLSSK